MSLDWQVIAKLLPSHCQVVAKLLPSYCQVIANQVFANKKYTIITKYLELTTRLAKTKQVSEGGHSMQYTK